MTEAPPPTNSQRRAPRWLRAILIAGILWGQILLIYVAITEPTPKNLTLLVSINLSGLYTVLLYFTRERWMPWFSKNKLRGAILIGVLNSAIIETLFLVIEKLFGASGVAAHPNLLIDLIVTMPWYIGIVVIFARVQKDNQYSDAAVLLIGGVYELGGDGIVGGQLFPIISGVPVNLVENWTLLLLIAVWQFILVYSSIVLPMAWVLHAEQTANTRRWRRWLRPMWWIIPFSLYLVIVLAIAANI